MQENNKTVHNISKRGVDRKIAVFRAMNIPEEMIRIIHYI